MKLFSIPQHGKNDLIFHGRELARVSEPSLVHAVWWDMRLLETTMGKLVLAASMNVPAHEPHAEPASMVINSALVFENIQLFEEYLRVESLPNNALGRELLGQANRALGRLFVPARTTSHADASSSPDTDDHHI